MKSIRDLNGVDRKTFVALLGHVFEHSPWVAQRAWDARPFASLDELHARMVAVMQSATREEQLALIRAHPELMGRLAQAQALSAESTREQAGAGLIDASDAELEKLASLNAAYRAKFGFPFIVAVRGLDRAQIAARLAERVRSSPDEEFAECLTQIARIARFRLEDLFGR
jgi:2-oxo-4-hydroxy-4-carboxy-5-ureidoimidazoline decarboxylase